MSELNQLLEELQSVERAEKQYDKVEQDLNNAYKELESLTKKLDNEYEDVEQLEKMSIKGVFHKVLGNKEQQLEKERQEYLQAVLKYDEYKKTVELLEFEKNVLVEKLQKASELRKKKQQLIAQREQQIIKSGSPVGQKLLLLEQEIQQSFHIKREIHEALTQGAKALELLAPMIKHLQSARNWGRYDMAGGKGMSTMMKHSSIDQARSLAHRLQRVLIHFEDELYDIYDKEQFQFSFKLDSFAQFTDIFFDNLITDWIVQQKIHNALANVVNVQDRIARIAKSLKVELDRMEATIQQLEEKKKDLILTAG